MKTIFIIAVCLCLALPAFPAQESIVDRPCISVSGTAVPHPRADLIVWTLGISDSDKDMLAAKRNNDQRVKAMLNIQLNQTDLVLTWTNSTLHLQGAPAPGGPYTNVPTAISPYTNILSSRRHFFRLSSN